MSLYPTRAQTIYKQPDFPKWKTWQFQLIDPLIDAAISAETDQYWGCKLTPQTRFFVLDLDNKPGRESKYRNPHGLKAIRDALREAGINDLRCYQSSKSGGWHVYGFFDDWVNSDELRDLLKAWLRLKDFDIDQGTLEIFPSNQGLRLPLQKGFAWLDSLGSIVQRREELTTEQALALFLGDLDSAANNWPTAKSLIESRLRASAAAAGGDAQEHARAISKEGFEALWNTGRIPERIEEACYYLDNGLRDDGQRHAAVISIQHLLWFGDRTRAVPRLPGTCNNEKRRRFVRDWLEQNHNGRCNHINQGDWETVDGQIRRATEWRRRGQPRAIEYEPYMVTERAAGAMIGLTRKTGHVWMPEDLERANQKREEQAREKIREAVQLLTSQGRRVTVRQLMRLTGCCNKTIKRHSDIYRILPLALLPSVGGDLEPGGAGGSVGLAACSDSEEEKKELCSLEIPGDSGELGIVRGDEAEVAPPLVSCPAGEPTTCTQHQDQALRVPSEVLTPGPVLRGIQAVPQEGAGGGLSYAAARTGKLCLFVYGSVRLWTGKQDRGISSPPGKLADAKNRPAAAAISVYTHSVSNCRFIRTAHLLLKVADIRCTRLRSRTFRLFVYGDVRGPPNCTRLI